MGRRHWRSLDVGHYRPAPQLNPRDTERPVSYDRSSSPPCVNSITDPSRRDAEIFAFQPL
jgi:hypothetical protein